MSNQYFDFKQFRIEQDKCSMKVGTDGVLLGSWFALEPGMSVLDIGTGTGLVALMAAQRGAGRVTAVEIDPDAAAQATQNVKKSPWAGLINVVNADIAKAAEGADLLIGDELTSSFIAASGKKYASIYKDDKAEFSVTINASVITAKLADIINECRQINAGTVRTLSAGDGIFVYSGDTALVEVPDFSASAE